jgi:exonuclease VII small subunit
MMYFAQMNNDVIIDQIPLSEIKVVKEMIFEADSSKVETKEMELMIETSLDGYNSGRTYYLQAETTALRQDIIKKISQYSTKAYEKAHAQSTLRRAQLRVRKVYQSLLFQRFTAFLIVSVGYMCIFGGQ